ncbi:MAG: SufE family protein [Pseudomonadota bacterium]
MSIQDAAAEIKDDFSFLEDWEDRYAHIIDLGKSLAPLAPEEMNDDTKVRGCASQVWLISETSATTPGGLSFRGASDAILVSGLIALLLSLFTDRTPDEILAFDADAFFAEIGVDQALSPQRSNGFKSMLERIRNDAADAAALNV